VLEFLDEKHAQARAELEEVFRFLDYTEFGGAPLLGVNGVTIICHGASQPRAIANAIGTAVRSARSGIMTEMARDLESLPPRWRLRPWRPRRRV
jgi:fatty acid/phospholipid biosynthesis enzyme